MSTPHTQEPEHHMHTNR